MGEGVRTSMATRVRPHGVLTAVAMSLIFMAGYLSVVSSAHAAEPVHWVTGTEGSELKGEESIGTVALGVSVFEGSILGSPLVINATGVEAVGLNISNAIGGATASGRLRLTGMSNQSGNGCQIASTSLSKPLTFQFRRVAGRAYVDIWATAGPNTALFTWELTGCPEATSVNVKGKGGEHPEPAIIGEFANSLGVYAVNQEVRFSKEGSLHVGLEPMTFKSALRLNMTGSLIGKVFGLH